MAVENVNEYVEEQEFTSEVKIAGDVIATIDSYKVNLSTDMILYEQSNKLLIKNVTNLKTYSE